MSANELSLKSFLLEDRLNRRLLWIAGIAILLQFVIFKILYPFAGFIDGDSYVYLQSAYFNLDINTYPIGYSRFLRLFSVFTKSDTALVAFQYLACQVTTLGFAFTLFYFYTPGKTMRYILWAFIIFNPVFLYISNYVSSDSLFYSLSMAWFTLLLWIIRKPTLRLIVLETIVLFLAFIVRYNALIYPLIAAIAFLLSRQSLKMTLIGIAANIFVVGAFIVSTANHYKVLSGIWQFTPFSGWQLANNAMYAYRYVDSVDRKAMPVRFQRLDNIVRHYFDTSRDLKKHPDEMLLASTVYMWDPKSPLNVFMDETFKKDSAAGRLKRWSSMAPIYAGYGSYLIRQYPMTYLKYYIWPNALKYYTPPEEFLETYNMGRDSVAGIGRVWFNYKTPKVTTAFKDLNVKALAFMPFLAAVMNIIFIFGSIFLLFFKIAPQDKTQISQLVLTCILWLANFGFSVFASPVTLRYQLFAILIFSSYSAILLDVICRMAFVQSKPAAVLT